MPDPEIAQLLLQLEIAENGLAMPFDKERVNHLRKMLVETRKRKVAERLKRMRAAQKNPGGRAPGLAD